MKSMLDYLKSWFGKKPKPVAPTKRKTLEELLVGDSVLVDFIDPFLMGYKNNEDVKIRFDKEDLEVKRVIGQITGIRKENRPDIYVIYLTSIKSTGLLRSYIFLEPEIVGIKLLATNKESGPVQT